MNPDPNEFWYQKYNCSHAHCPYSCEHPQPFLLYGWVLICGACFFKNEEITFMIPCKC